MVVSSGGGCGFTRRNQLCRRGAGHFHHYARTIPRWDQALYDVPCTAQAQMYATRVTRGMLCLPVPGLRYCKFALVQQRIVSTPVQVPDSLHWSRTEAAIKRAHTRTDAAVTSRVAPHPNQPRSVPLPPLQDAKQRPDARSLLQHEWLQHNRRTLRSGVPGAALPHTAVAQPRRWSRRHRQVTEAHKSIAAVVARTVAAADDNETSVRPGGVAAGRGGDAAQAAAAMEGH